MSRIPPFQTGAQWAAAMHAADLSYHIDDDPADIIHNTTGEPLFTPEECVELRAIVAAMPFAEYEAYMETTLDIINEQNETHHQASI